MPSCGSMHWIEWRLLGEYGRYIITLTCATKRYEHLMGALWSLYSMMLMLTLTMSTTDVWPLFPIKTFLKTFYFLEVTISTHIRVFDVPASEKLVLPSLSTVIAKHDQPRLVLSFGSAGAPCRACTRSTTIHRTVLVVLETIVLYSTCTQLQHCVISFVGLRRNCCY